MLDDSVIALLFLALVLCAYRQSILGYLSPTRARRYNQRRIDRFTKHVRSLIDEGHLHSRLSARDYVHRHFPTLIVPRAHRQSPGWEKHRNGSLIQKETTYINACSGLASTRQQ